MRKGISYLILLGFLLVIGFASCGTSNVGVIDSESLDDSRTTTGVTIGDYEVIRANTSGTFDPALNFTLGLDLENTADGQALKIKVNDSTLVNDVALEVRYNGERVHADRTEFHNLLGSGDSVLNGSFLTVNSIAGLGTVRVNGNEPASVSGDYATLYFNNGPSRTVSLGGLPHKNNAGLGYVVYSADENLPCLTAEGDDTAKVVTLTWSGAWHTADGNQDGLITSADLTPLGIFFGQNVNDNWQCARADYSFDRFVTANDLTPIGQNFNAGTSWYKVEASDNVDGAARAVVQEQVLWKGEETMPFSLVQADIVDGELYPCFTQWQLVFNNTDSTVSYDTIAGYDLNGDDNVRFYVTPHNDPLGDSAEAFVDVNVDGEKPPEKDIVIVTDYHIQVVGAGDGIGAANDIFDQTDANGTVPANGDLTFTLSSIDGNFGADAFTGSDNTSWPTGLTQAIYDAVLADIAANLTWTPDHEGADGFRRTTDWAVLDTGTWPVTGNPGDATVFPDDDDPDSGAATPEGLLGTALPAETTPGVNYLSTADLEVRVYADIDRAFKFDVTADSGALMMDSYLDYDEKPLGKLTLNEPNGVHIPITWGDGGVPTEFSILALELHRINTTTGLSDEITQTFSYIEGEPDPGQFTMREFAGDYTIRVNVPGGSLIGERYYAFRMQAAGIWSSINNPALMLQTQPPPPPQDLVVVPVHCGPSVDTLQVFYADPKVRRNPGMTFDLGTGSLTKDDPIAYDDLLKLEGDEFILQSSGGLWPKCAVMQTDDPSQITSVGDGIVGVLSIQPNPGRVMIDIAPLTVTGLPDDPVLDYSFKFFNSDGSAVGQGTFDVAPLNVPTGSPVGINWGINVWDRVNLGIDDRQYTDFSINGDVCYLDAPQPDVIWVEFGGGWMFDADQDESKLDPPDTIQNVKLFLDDTAGGGDMYCQLALRIVGVTAAGNYIAIHSFHPGHWEHPLAGGGWYGKFDTNEIYKVYLDDPHFAGLEWEFPQTLFVQGQNPNDP